MTILDLRPSVVRWFSRERSGGGGPAAAAAGRLADFLIARRVAARERPSKRLQVVSVGNLALGGTGKTPVVTALARDLAAAGGAGAILTRGYGSSLPGPLLVAPGDDRAGDEARLMASDLASAGWPVVQSRDRRRGLRLLEERLPAGATVILEDGHQTAGVGRHLDIVILDRWECDAATGVLAPRCGPVAPFGAWRETGGGAERAAIWLVEGEPRGVPPQGRALAGFARSSVLVTVDGRTASPPTGPWAALSGIARPERFEAGVEAAAGTAPALAVRCADHEPYGEARLARVFAALRAVAPSVVVTTMKDHVKLAGRWPSDLPLLIARQELRWTGAQALPELVQERLALVARR